MMLYKGFLLFLLAAPGDVASLSCYSCNNVDNLNSCKTKTTCEERQSCFTRLENKGQSASFTLGCIQNEYCSSIPVYNNVSKMNNGQLIQECEECCGVDQCNKDLHVCNYKTPLPCSDNIENCAFWDKGFGICENIHKAKSVCRKFCKLCDLVDGNWADWSPWSSCDVTCGHGKHTRIRTCTNPAPAYKGMECNGNNTDTKHCTRPLCPVHGGWAGWSSWEPCPVTCDIGIQKRHRKCTNPSPLRHGDHCFGESMDVKLCKQHPCDELDSSVSFNAYHVTDYNPRINQIMVFSKILTNEGGAYNPSTGFFVAPKDGTYTLYAQLCIVNEKSIHFDIMVGSKVYASTYGYSYGSSECPSTQTFAKMKSGDRAYVQWKTYSYMKNVVQQSAMFRNSFSGQYSNH